MQWKLPSKSPRKAKSNRLRQQALQAISMRRPEVGAPPPSNREQPMLRPQQVTQSARRERP